MSKLIRFVYASRSTSLPDTQFQGLDLGVARILAKSRKNNQEQGIVGGLFFGDGYFLQCLEGTEKNVLALYKKIQADTRHQDVTELARKPIQERTFGDWSMKYVPGEQLFGDLMQSWGMTHFDPYVLTPVQIETAVGYLREQADLAHKLPDDAQHLSNRQSPKSYIGKNKPFPGAINAPVNSSHAKLESTSQFKEPTPWNWGMVGGVIAAGAALISGAALLYFAA